MAKPGPGNPEGGDDQQVSLAPLTPEEALRALLKINPDDPPADDQDDDEAPAD